MRVTYALIVMHTILVAFHPQYVYAVQDEDETVATVKESIRESTPALQTKRDAPEYPWSELRRGREAWVHVTYCIDETGAIQNVSILDSIGNEKFDKAAIDTVRNWAFEPAIQNGKPAWQSRNEVYIRFAIENEDLGASRKFVRQFKKLGEYIEDGDLEQADKLFRQVYESEKLTLYELGKLWAQRVRYEAKVGDYYRLNMALKRATASHGSWIEPENYIRFLKLRTQVEMHLGKYNQALHSFKDLKDAAGENAEVVTSLLPAVENLRAMIDGDRVLQISAEVRERGDCIYCNDSWDFTPVRSAFTITNIKGELASLDMRCDNKRFEAKIADLVEWHIPDDWGKCHIQVYGEPGTTFDVLMLPNADS